MEMLTKEKLDSWYTPINSMKPIIKIKPEEITVTKEGLVIQSKQLNTIMDAIQAQIEEDGICPNCLGEGYITVQTAADDDYTRRCECNLRDEDEREEE